MRSGGEQCPERPVLGFGCVGVDGDYFVGLDGWIEGSRAHAHFGEVIYILIV